MDILDGALARAGGKGTPFGAFLDSTLDRVGEAFMLGAAALVFARDGKTWAVAIAFAAVVGSLARQLHTGEGRDHRPQG